MTDNKLMLIDILLKSSAIVGSNLLTTKAIEMSHSEECLLNSSNETKYPCLFGKENWEPYMIDYYLDSKMTVCPYTEPKVCYNSLIVDSEGDYEENITKEYIPLRPHRHRHLYLNVRDRDAHIKQRNLNMKFWNEILFISSYISHNRGCLIFKSVHGHNGCLNGYEYWNDELVDNYRCLSEHCFF